MTECVTQELMWSYKLIALGTYCTVQPMDISMQGWEVILLDNFSELSKKFIIDHGDDPVDIL